MAYGSEGGENVGFLQHRNTCSKSIVQKLGFLHGSITTNDEHVLLTIKCKWLEAIVHMTKF